MYSRGTRLTAHLGASRPRLITHLGAISTRGTPDAPSGELRLVAAGFGCDSEANRERAEVMNEPWIAGMSGALVWTLKHDACERIANEKSKVSADSKLEHIFNCLKTCSYTYLF